MFNPGRSLRAHGPMRIGLVVLAVLAILASWRLASGPGAAHFVDLPVLELPLPQLTTAAPAEDPAGAAQVVPAAPNLTLVEASPFGPLPRLGPNGERAFATYARPFERPDDRPLVAVLVTGLGLDVDAANAAFHLPGAFSLSFSAYSPDLPTLFERARLAGHEIILDLPMEPENYPDDDPGPHTLLAAGPDEQNLERLTWLLARAPGYAAVGGSGTAFTASEGAGFVIEALDARGLGLVEIGGDALQAGADEQELPYASAALAIDAEPAAGAIDAALAQLEARAREDGLALGYAEAYPITLERLAAWAAGLEQKGLVLAPVSAVMKQRSGLSEGARQGEDGELARSTD